MHLQSQCQPHKAAYEFLQVSVNVVLHLRVDEDEKWRVFHSDGFGWQFWVRHIWISTFATLHVPTCSLPREIFGPLQVHKCLKLTIVWTYHRQLSHCLLIPGLWNAKALYWRATISSTLPAQDSFHSAENQYTWERKPPFTLEQNQEQLKRFYLIQDDSLRESISTNNLCEESVDLQNNHPNRGTSKSTVLCCLLY